MTVGQKYRVIFTYHSGNGRKYTKEMIGIYVGLVRGEPGFSLRPLAGTTEIPAEDIQSAEETDRPVLLPHMHRA